MLRIISRPFRGHVTSLGTLFTYTHLCQPAVQHGST